MRHEAIEAPAPHRWAGLFERRFFALVAAIWALAALVMIGIAWTSIVTGGYSDADDQLRLVEVHDWIDGQAFRDVTQYRMSPPAGAPMHWSRLVDMPIAVPILILRPLVGYVAAETVAAVLVPMLLLLGAMMAVAGIARRLAGPGAGLFAAAMSVATFGVIVQFSPLRVDHHNWQILLSLVATAAALARPGRRSGAIAGVAMAFALQISLETLPFAAVFGAVLAAAWALSPSAGNRDRMLAFAATLFAVELVLTAVMRADFTGYCDAVSAPHFAALGTAAAGLALATRPAFAARWMRFTALAVVAGAGAAAFRAGPPHCGVDAFPMLEPIVRHDWYEHVMEGMPVWLQSRITASVSMGFPLVALACAAVALRGARGADRTRWATYVALLIGATAIGAMVERAACLASLIAVPAAAWAAVRLVSGTLRSRHAATRVFGTVAIVLALSPMASGMVAAAMPWMRDAANAPHENTANCGSSAAISALGALPAGTVFAPMNIGPAILLRTHHSIVTSGYHRNHAVIADEIAAFLGSDWTARGILDRHRVRYVEFCADRSETAFYAQAAPHGFAAHLAAGRAPDWLRPIRVRPDGISFWEVVR